MRRMSIGLGYGKWRLSAAALVSTLAVSSAVYGEHGFTAYSAGTIAPDIGSYARRVSVSGHMTIAGSDTMQPVLVKLALEFQRRHPDVKIAVQGSRDSKLGPEETFLTGLAAMRRGDGNPSGHLGSYDVQLLALSRPLTEEEISRFTARYGYAPTAVTIAQDAVALYVNQENPLAQLSLDQVDAIFSKTRKRGLPDINKWGQLGLTGEWEQAPIHLYGRDQRSTGTLPFFKHVVMRDGEFKPSIISQPGSASVVVAVGKDPHAIGYSGIGFQTSAVRALPLSHKPDSPAVAPTAESVMDGSYPLSRPLFLYVNRNPDKEWDPRILEFLRFINSREGQETVTRAGVYPLSSQQVKDNLALLDAAPLRASIH